jgi:hypothetical protein
MKLKLPQNLKNNIANLIQAGLPDSQDLSSRYATEKEKEITECLTHI